MTPFRCRTCLRLLLVALLSILPWMNGCDRGEEVVSVDMGKRETIHQPGQDQALTYAYLPQYSHTVSYKRHNPLVRYLAQKTGLAIRQVFPNTFDEHLDMVRQGKIDISFSNPMVYVHLAEAGARAFARIIEPSSGKPVFRGQIIARADNPFVTRLSDCAGKRWIAVDPLSTGGYLLALGYFKDHGISRDSFACIDFAPGPAGKQEKAILAVYAGKYDIASIREGALSVVSRKIEPDSIRIIATTPPYPSWVYSARKGLDQNIVDRIARAMFTLSLNNPQQAEILRTAGMDGIIPTVDRDYDPIRRLARRLIHDMPPASTPSCNQAGQREGDS
ncbi:phosphate/phosphite/phosphonate ABC transporter substrate-binding protein [Desulfoplanes formicivorans]|uniref:Phosphonate ABC transporter substrate-binding protein n=1 Tax=Desulfoplanes formicivorans TaxID=1592317 RepID=A0A194AH48_9BACT|nr:phosphate/phosphite/phosphonate ABC transporter substrate-binding protein [Desulfoplanes formicivorans]GAU09407.1 phosphonate ABC transporter substrate-binding protein [Desulfoplanes formicivorans]